MTERDDDHSVESTATAVNRWRFLGGTGATMKEMVSEVNDGTDLTANRQRSPFDPAVIHVFDAVTGDNLLDEGHSTIHTEETEHAA